MEGLPGVLGNKGTLAKISKGTREHEPIFREHGNKTVQIRGRKHFDIINRERRLFLRFYLWSFMYNCHFFFYFTQEITRKQTKSRLSAGSLGTRLRGSQVGGNLLSQIAKVEDRSFADRVVLPVTAAAYKSAI